MKITHSMEVACSPERLWAFIEEPEKQKLWMKGLLTNELTGGEAGEAGSTFRMTIKEGRKVGDYEGEVVASDKPRHLAVKMTADHLPKGMDIVADYRLTDLGEGRTRLDYEGGCEGGEENMGFFMKIMMKVGIKFAKKQFNGFMAALKRLAEEEE